MDPNEKKHIRGNLETLVEDTQCHCNLLAIFESKGILGKMDVQRINQEKTSMGQAKVFYEIIQGRSGAYQVLRYALQRTNQTGVLDILGKLPEKDSTTATSPETDGGYLEVENDKRNTPLVECYIPDIVELWQASAVSSVLHNEWRSLATKVRTPGHEIEQYRQRIILSQITAFEAVISILENWAQRATGRSVTIGELIVILEDNSWNEFARLVKQKYDIP